MLKQMMPALLLLALLDSTTPALAMGQIPVCTQTGIRWTPLDGSDSPSPRDSNPVCAHGWCKPRRQKIA